MAASRRCLPFMDSSQVPYGWCDTDMQKIKFGYVWTIKKFSYLQETAGQYIESSNFSASEDDKNKWCLNLYPRGVDEEHRNHVAVFLKHRPARESLQVAVPYFEVSVVNTKKEKSNVTKGTNTAFKKGLRVLGYINFIRREDLIKERNGYMQNDELTLCCEIVIPKEYENVQGRYNAVSVKNDSGCVGVTEDLGRLLDSADLSDVVLVAEGRDLQAHKIILAARSPVFAAMFQHDMTEKRTNRVQISDVPFKALEDLIRFIYTGRNPATKDQETTVQLLQAADKYGLEELKSMCEEALCANITTENFAGLVALASLHSADHLQNRLVEFMKNFAKDDVYQRLWKGIIVHNPEFLAATFRDCK